MNNEINELKNTINQLTYDIKKLQSEIVFVKHELRSQEKFNRKMFFLLSKQIEDGLAAQDEYRFNAAKLSFPNISEKEAQELADDNNWLNELIDYVNSRNFSISPNEVAKEEFEDALKEAN